MQKRTSNAFLALKEIFAAFQTASVNILCGHPRGSFAASIEKRQ
jgi:hypothetical protein